MVRINWTNRALSDLKDISDFISLDSKKYAEIQIRRIKSKSNILKENPELGKMVPEIGEFKYRELIEGNYRIIYKLINKKQIDILTIHHSARDLSKRKID